MQVPISFDLFYLCLRLKIILVLIYVIIFMYLESVESDINKCLELYILLFMYLYCTKCTSCSLGIYYFKIKKEIMIKLDTILALFIHINCFIDR